MNTEVDERLITTIDKHRSEKDAHHIYLTDGTYFCATNVVQVKSYQTGTRVTQMIIPGPTIAANPGCSGGETAAALNTPTTTINAELRRLWRSGSAHKKERKTGGRFSYQVKPDVPAWVAATHSTQIVQPATEGNQSMSTSNCRKPSSGFQQLIRQQNKLH